MRNFWRRPPGKSWRERKKQLQSSYDQSLEDLAELEQGGRAAGSGVCHAAYGRGEAGSGGLERDPDRPGPHLRGSEPGPLAMDNQLRGDLAAIANTRDAATAELARKRQALSRDLAQQLEQAQLESDYEQVMQRYQLRKDQDSQGGPEPEGHGGASGAGWGFQPLWRALRPHA